MTQDIEAAEGLVETFVTPAVMSFCTTFS